MSDETHPNLLSEKAPSMSDETHPMNGTDLSCTWLGTAGFLFRAGDTTLVSDPFLSRPAGVAPFPIPRARLGEADGLLCTHGHFDHAMDLEQVARLSKAPLWAPDVVCARLSRLGIEPARLHANERTSQGRVGPVGEAGEILFEPIPSRHIRFDAPLVATTLRSVLRGGTLRELAALALLWPMGSNTDYRIRVGSLTAYLAGSLGQSEERLAAERIDVALLPYNGRSDMAQVTLRAARALAPRLLVLHHFDDFYPDFAPPQNPLESVEWLRERLPDVRIYIPEMGVPFSVSSLLAPR